MLDKTTKFAKLNRQQIFAIGKELEKVCRCVNGFAVYDPEWNDETFFKFCQEKFKIEASMKSIVGLRQEIIGHLQGSTPTMVLQERVDKLEKLLLAHEENTKTLLGLQDIVERLVEWANTRPKGPFTYDFQVLMREWKD